uniref:Uncharacterized protein n=1 Tax=Oryza brachyantha TaxID=4533 RepID=J3KWZ3_ORYBR
MRACTARATWCVAGAEEDDDEETLASYPCDRSSSHPSRPPRPRVDRHLFFAVVGRCNAVLKEHKTRLYILGRCVSMLLC